MPSGLEKPLTVGTLLAVAALGLPGVANAATGAPVDLGTLPGDQYSFVAAVKAGGTETNLGTLPGGDYSWATGIAADGTVVGLATTSGGAGQHAVYWPAA
jgi:hypothetical protein